MRHVDKATKPLKGRVIWLGWQHDVASAPRRGDGMSTSGRHGLPRSRPSAPASGSTILNRASRSGRPASSPRADLTCVRCFRILGDRKADALETKLERGGFQSSASDVSAVAGRRRVVAEGYRAPRASAYIGPRRLTSGPAIGRSNVSTGSAPDQIADGIGVMVDDAGGDAPSSIAVLENTFRRPPTELPLDHGILIRLGRRRLSHGNVGRKRQSDQERGTALHARKPLCRPTRGRTLIGETRRHPDIQPNRPNKTSKPPGAVPGRMKSADVSGGIGSRHRWTRL